MVHSKAQVNDTDSKSKPLGACKDKYPAMRTNATQVQAQHPGWVKAMQ